MERQRIIDIKDGQTGNPAYRMARPLNLAIYDGEQVAIVGDNAAGKTRLVEALAGVNPVQGTALRYDFSPSPLRLVGENVKYIAFRDTYDGADNNYYLQKRWNRQDIDDDTPTAGELLDRAFEAAENGSGRLLDAAARTRLHERRVELRDRLYALFGLDALLDKFIITLSSGELRKFQLTRTLLAMPRVLVLDNPFIGLDAATRDSLSELLGTLTENMDLLLILVMSRVDVMPPFITHVIPVEGLDVLPKVPVAEYLASRDSGHPSLPPADAGIRDAILAFPFKDLDSEPFYPARSIPAPEIVRCTGVTIRYGSRTILQDFDWTVREGERWAITGENGSGKSTLLSLVCADNPQGYACDIALFGHRRGSGESIWEIKRHIGYVSPEMHRAYLKNIAALDIVASGLFDTVGLFMHPTEDQLDTCRQWMRIFGIEDLADRPYLRLSSGEQRLCLLARAFVKDPELLILDEPMHGLDLHHCARVKAIIDAFVQRPRKTLLMVSHYDSELPSCIDHHLRLTRR
jgi:molybdate transport system ATP-binding protein